jgi:hypothetical protein
VRPGIEMEKEIAHATQTVLLSIIAAMSTQAVDYAGIIIAFSFGLSMVIRTAIKAYKT